MDWYRIQHRESDEVQYVAGLDGIDLEAWSAEPIPSEPPVDAEAIVDDGVWVIPLAVQKERAWDLVKDRRDRCDDGVAPTPIGPVQCDDRSKIKISGLVTMAMLALQNGASFDEPFTMADNSVVTLNAVTAIQMGMAVGQFVSAIHGHARELREQIDASETVEALNAIDIETGWP